MLRKEMSLPVKSKPEKEYKLMIIDYIPCDECDTTGKVWHSGYEDDYGMYCSIAEHLQKYIICSRCAGRGWTYNNKMIPGQIINNNFVPFPIHEKKINELQNKINALVFEQKELIKEQQKDELNDNGY